MFTPTKKIMDFLNRPVYSGMNLFLCLNRFCPFCSLFKIGYMTRDEKYFKQKLKTELKMTGKCFLFICLFLLLCAFFEDIFTENFIYYGLIGLCFFLLFKAVFFAQICVGLLLFVLSYVYNTGMLLGDLFLIWGGLSFLISNKDFLFPIFISVIGAFLSAQESVLHASLFYVLFSVLCLSEIFLVVQKLKKRKMIYASSESVQKMITSFEQKIDDERFLPKLEKIKFYSFEQALFVLFGISFLTGIFYLMGQDVYSFVHVKDFYFPESGVFLLQFIFICFYALLFPDLSVRERFFIFGSFVVLMTFIPNMAMMGILLGLAFCYLINAYTIFFILFKAFAVDFLLILLSCNIGFKQSAVAVAIFSIICFIFARRKQHD